MTNFFVNDELLMDDERYTADILSSENIALDPEQINWAVELSQNAPTEAERWQTYLSTVALLGFQEWLHKRSPELTLDSNWLPGLTQPELMQVAHLSQQICRLKIGEFKLYLLLTDCLQDPMVTVPKAIVDLTDFAPDVYVLVEVLEEIGEVHIYGYLPQMQLANQGDVASLSQEDNQTVLLSVDQFIPDPDNLLYTLRYSDVTIFRPAAITEPTVSTNQIASPDQTISTNQTIGTKALNVATWLQDRLDRVAEELSWILLPPAALNLSGALMSLRSVRSPLEDLDAVVTELRRDQAVVIPAEARAAYRDLQLEAAAIRLYALTWLPAGTDPEWSLLLILGAQPGSQLPSEITLKVEDDTQILIEENLRQAPYLYAQTVGTWDEQFRVTIALPNGASLTLPPLRFDPNPDT